MIGGLPAYAMYDMGEGDFWNEVALTGNIKNGQKYDQAILTIRETLFDSDRGELELQLQRNNGPCYGFILFHDSVIQSILYNHGVNRYDGLVGRKVVGLFDKDKSLQWIVTVARPVSVESSRG